MARIEIPDRAMGAEEMRSIRDDQEGKRLYHVTCYEETEYEVRASSREEALERYRSGQYEVIGTDDGCTVQEVR